MYVDDIILIRENDEILKLKRLVASEFENKDLGLVRLPRDDSCSIQEGIVLSE